MISNLFVLGAIAFFLIAQIGVYHLPQCGSERPWVNPWSPMAAIGMAGSLICFVGAIFT